MMKAAIIGNCQIDGIARSLRAMVPGLELTTLRPKEIIGAQINSDTEVIFLQSDFIGRTKKYLGNALESKCQIVTFPGMYFTAFHPDFAYITYDGRHLESPIGHINSAIVLNAWKSGFSAGEAVGLFNHDVFDELGYFTHWQTSAQKLIEDGATHEMDLRQELDLWGKSGCFLHCPNHPKITPLAGMARSILKKLNIRPGINYPENYLDDPLIYNLVWPQYPEIVKQFGFEGEYVFRGTARPADPFSKCLDLEEFVAGCFEMWANNDPSRLESPRLADRRFDNLHRFRRSSGSGKKFRSPYSDIKDFQLWKRAVATPEIEDIDPVVGTKFKISRSDRVATAGSCFAQHISKALADNGYNYFVPENGTGLSLEEAAARNYGVFSARYGNIYTTRQLLQLFDRSEGTFTPDEKSWMRNDGSFVDPFRPQIEPKGFSNPYALEDSRKEHLAQVSQLWRQCDVLVFTLGLTEGWLSKQDGAAFPVAPGVSGGEFNEESYRFQNFSVRETVEDLREFLGKLRAINPGVRVILTVSPVPLIATAENQHVLVSTTLSKAVLRAAAHEVAVDDPLVQYFPSFEIITGAFNRGRYFESDLRTVTSEGVAHVMRVFLKHFSDLDSLEVTSRKRLPDNDLLRQEIQAGLAIVCDEEAIESAAF
jgi:hypothetical protein